MNASMGDLLRRQEIDREVISLRNSLLNHVDGLAIGLRDAQIRFLTLADGDGYARGCHRPTQAIAGDLAHVVPSWVSANPRDTRTVEGILTMSKITHTDFPLRPWHTYYDWNFFVRVDRQYTELHSTSNLRDHGGVIECEWDTAFTPSWAWPQDGDRIWMLGRWIYDCGHPGDNGHKTEIHPPKAMASIRREAATFAGNRGPTQASVAALYIGRNGGYWRQPIADQDYAFDLYLPPKPYPEAQPRWNVLPQTGALPVEPRITPYPADDPRALRVVIPMTQAREHPEEYGAIIAGGWSDPRGTESRGVQRVRVEVTRIFMDGDYDTFGDEWYVYIGVNGRWNFWNDIGGASQGLSFTVDLDLHPSDRIHITACGFEADLVHDFMGDNSGKSWAQISDPNITQAQREEIEDDIFWQLSGSLTDENEEIGYLTRFHAATERGTFTAGSDKGDYRVRYTINER